MQRLCRLDELPLDAIRTFYCEGVPYLVYREGDQVFACEGICPHLGASLAEGDTLNGCVTCPWHGWRFDLKSGHCENVKGQQLQRVAIEVRQGEVYWNTR